MRWDFSKTLNALIYMGIRKRYTSQRYSIFCCHKVSPNKELILFSNKGEKSSTDGEIIYTSFRNYEKKKEKKKVTCTFENGLFSILRKHTKARRKCFNVFVSNVYNRVTASPRVDNILLSNMLCYPISNPYDRA